MGRLHDDGAGTFPVCRISVNAEDKNEGNGQGCREEFRHHGLLRNIGGAIRRGFRHYRHGRAFSIERVREGVLAFQSSVWGITWEFGGTRVQKPLWTSAASASMKGPSTMVGRWPRAKTSLQGRSKIEFWGVGFSSLPVSLCRLSCERA